MPIYKRNNGIWYVDITTAGGRRIRQSAGTKIREEAQKLHDKLAYELWQQQHLERKPDRLWEKAAVRWIKEQGGKKKSIKDDISRLRGLPHFREVLLNDMSRDFIMDTVGGFNCSDSTKNRYLALIRAILNKAAKEWQWLDNVPKITLYREAKRRIRWLTQ
ncbi:site-specific integrase, partial [Neisseria dentiae]|nr:site-specific integrase [Neisseria dentiae]